jgi:hypothetical protein
MLTASLTRRRKLALGIALPWVLFTSIYYFHTLHFGAGLPFVHWHIAAIVAWTLPSAAASGLVITELLRLAARSGATWSDKRHFRIALIVAMVLLGVQWLSLGLAFHSARAF